jgi:GTPase
MKPVILVINKWDKARDAFLQQHEGEEDKFRDSDAMEEYGTYLDAELKFIDYAPIAFTTAKEGKNIQAVLDLAQGLYNQANERVSTGKLNAAIEQVVQEKPPSSNKRSAPRVYYATQVAVGPPTIVLFVNRPEAFDDNYMRYTINRFRELLPYAEVPIKLEVRARSRAEEPGDKPTRQRTDNRVVQRPVKKRRSGKDH